MRERASPKVMSAFFSQFLCQEAAAAEEKREGALESFHQTDKQTVCGGEGARGATLDCRRGDQGNRMTDFHQPTLNAPPALLTKTGRVAAGEEAGGGSAKSLLHLTCTPHHPLPLPSFRPETGLVWPTSQGDLFPSVELSIRARRVCEEGGVSRREWEGGGAD